MQYQDGRLNPCSVLTAPGLSVTNFKNRLRTPRRVNEPRDASSHPQARDDLTDAMCKKEMGVYTAIFGTTGDTAALERTDRRYLWLRKRLGARQEVGHDFRQSFTRPRCAWVQIVE